MGRCCLIRVTSSTDVGFIFSWQNSFGMSEQTWRGTWMSLQTWLGTCLHSTRWPSVQTVSVSWRCTLLGTSSHLEVGISSHTCLAILLQFWDGTSLHCCDGISEQTSFWTSVHCCSNSVLQFSTGVSSQTFSHFSS